MKSKDANKINANNINQTINKFVFIILLFFWLIPLNIFSDESVNQSNEFNKLFDLPFEDLFKLQVNSSTFTKIEKLDEPASVTVITSEDIRNTPKRSLYDLLEVYVPGAIWMTHYDSPHIGFRGIINQRNDKFLVLVNGKMTNFKAHNGATNELENWDLDDIEKIEVVRGGGSVIYGPGAVAAVINITTKKNSILDNKNYTEIKSKFYNEYNSIGVSLNGKYDLSDDVKMFAFASVVSTQGIQPKSGFYIPNNDIILDLDTANRLKYPYLYQETWQLSDLFVDANNKPQIKTHLQFTLGNNSNLWLRYTRNGSTFNGVTFKQKYQTGFDSVNFYTTSDFINFTVTNNEQVILSFDNFYELNKNHSIKTFFTFDSENNSRAMDYLQKHPEAFAPPKEIMDMLSDINSLRNKYYAVSETEVQLRSILNSELASNLFSAIGIEYTRNIWGKSWFKDDGYIRLGDSWNIISDANSPAYGYKDFFGTDSNDVFFVGKGWQTNTFSLFGELNYEFNDFRFLTSARLDKDDYSDYLFSPRLAIIYSIDNKNKLKFITQRSVRMNTAEELLIQNRKNIKPSNEVMDNIELIYVSSINDNLLLNLSTYYNNAEILSWKDPLRSTILIGNLQKIGFEFDLIYRNEFLSLTLNHTYNKQLNWDLADNAYQSGISYSDYNTPINGSSFTGIGNDLNNWSNNVTKIITNIKLFDKNLNFHLNSRIFWNFQGAQDGLLMMKNAAQNSTDINTTNKVNEIISIIEKYDTYSTDIRINSSVSYQYNDFNFRIYAMNLINITNNKRLRYDTGSKEQQYNYYMKNSMFVEPTSFGISISYKI